MDKVGGLGTAAGYGRDSAGPMNATCEVERQPHVAEAVINHRSLAEHLSELTVQLEKRLSPITRNEPKATQAGEGPNKLPQRSVRVELAEAIEGNNMALQASVYRLCSILERLEL